MNLLIPKIIGTCLNLCSWIAPKWTAHKAFEIFATPRKGKIQERHLPLLDTARKETLTYENDAIQVYVWDGSKKTILLSHGWESNAGRWRDMMDDLRSTGYRIVALDAPAHGNSSGKNFTAVHYAEFLRVVCTKYKPEIIIGHSVGGMAPVFMNYKYPQPQLEKIVTLGAPSNFQYIMDQFVTVLGLSKRSNKKLDQYIFDRYGMRFKDFGLINFLAPLNAEMLVVHDKRDRIIPYKDAINIVRAYKKATLVKTEGLGHSLIGQEVNDAIMMFIKN